MNKQTQKQTDRLITQSKRRQTFRQTYEKMNKPRERQTDKYKRTDRDKDERTDSQKNYTYTDTEFASVSRD